MTPQDIIRTARRDCAAEIRRVLRAVGGPVSRADLHRILGDSYTVPIIDAAIDDVLREGRAVVPPSRPFPINLAMDFPVFTIRQTDLTAWRC